MADQEFLASFAVDIDETGVSRLQSVLEENRDLANEVAAAFSAATAAIREYAAELAESMPGLLSGAGHGITMENAFGSAGGIKLGLDTTRADSELKEFSARAKKPVPLSANASGILSAARAAYNSIVSLFSTPVSIRAKVEREGNTGPDGPVAKMSSGGRFTKPTDVQVAEDGDAEYIIPVRKEDRAVPLLRQLLGELSPAARESLSGGVPLTGGLSAGTAGVTQITQTSRNVSAPVSIQVRASGSDPEEIGQSIYHTAERYLLRTMESVFV